MDLSQQRFDGGIDENVFDAIGRIYQLVRYSPFVNDIMMVDDFLINSIQSSLACSISRQIQ